MMCAVNTLAFEVNSYVYTASQRLKITGENLLTNGNFAEALDGWTNADGEAVNQETWSVEAEAGPNGEAALKALNATAGNALCQVLMLDPGTYVVSYQTKLPADGIVYASSESTSNNVTTLSTPSTNQHDIFVNTDGNRNRVLSATEAPVRSVANSWTYVGTDWKTINYAVTIEEGEILVLHFEKCAAESMLANFTVQLAEEVYDNRAFLNRIAYAKTLMNEPEFNTEAAADNRGTLEYIISVVEQLTENSGMESEAEAQDMLSGFNEAFEDFLGVTSVNLTKETYFKYVEDLTACPKYNRGSDQTADGAILGGFRFHGANWWHADKAAYFTKQIQGGASYEVGPGSIALYNTKMPAGRYFVTAEMRNARCNKDYSLVFNHEAAVKAFVGTNEKELGTIIGEDYVRFYYIADFDGSQDFEAGFWWDGPLHDGTFHIGNFEIRTFNMEVEADVAHITAWEKFIAQWNSAVNARNAVVAKIGDKNYPWEQDSLQRALTNWDPFYNEIIEKGWVTADGKDAGVATTEELDEWADYQGADPELGQKYQLVRGYQYANSYVVAANKPFSDLAAEINTAIAMRDDAMNVNGDKETFQAAINEAQTILDNMLNTTSDATREADEASLAQALLNLQEAEAAFLKSAELKPMVDIDFSTTPAQDEEGNWYIDGVDGRGRMTFTLFEKDNTVTSNVPFTLGTGGTDGEYLDVLRVGNSEATVVLPEMPGDEDVIRTSFDMWIGGLSKGYIWVDLRNESNERVAGFKWQIYNGDVNYNDFNNEANEGMNLAGKNKGTGKDGDGVIHQDKYKYSFDLILDYKANAVKGKLVQGSQGTVDGAYVAMQNLSDNKAYKFVVGSSYNYADARRSWFDDLKIYKYPSTAEGPLFDGIMPVSTVKTTASDAVYTLSGMKVSGAMQKGIYIQNGKKFVVK